MKYNEATLGKYFYTGGNPEGRSLEDKKQDVDT